MQNCKTSAGTAAQQSSKSPLLFRPAALAAILLLAAVLSSCSEFFPNDGRYLIRDVNYTSDKKMAIYELIPIKGMGLVFYTDSIAKFNINDTLVLCK